MANIKTTATELKAFLEDDSFWPDDAFYEDALILDTQKKDVSEKLSDLPAQTELVLAGGVYHPDSNPLSGCIDLTTIFRRWRKQSSKVFLTVKCDRADLEKVKAAIIAAGGSC